MTHNLNSHHMFSPAMNKDWIFCRSIGYTRIFFQVKPGWSWYGVIKRILVSMLFETPSAEVRSYTIYSPWRGRENVRMLLHARAKSTAQLGSALFRRLHTLLKFLAWFIWPFLGLMYHYRMGPEKSQAFWRVTRESVDTQYIVDWVWQWAYKLPPIYPGHLGEFNLEYYW